MAKRYIVRLSDEERKLLTDLLGQKVLAAKKRMRVQVLLKADASPEGPAWIDSRIAEAFEVTVLTIEKIRKSYVLEGLDAAIERKKQCRPSRQPVLDGAKEARLVALCCGTVPAGRGRWTLRPLADKLVELKQVAAWESDRNKQQKGVDWQFTTADARVKLKRLYPKDSKLTLR